MTAEDAFPTGRIAVVDMRDLKPKFILLFILHINYTKPLSIMYAKKAFGASHGIFNCLFT